MTVATANVDVLRQGWGDAVSALAPDVADLAILIEARIEEAVRENKLDEQALLLVVDEAARVAARSTGGDTARLLTRRLQRAVYEYLLSIDAASPEEEVESVSQALAGLSKAGPLIGAEEVAELGGGELQDSAPAREHRRNRFRIFRRSTEAEDALEADEPRAVVELEPDPEPVAAAAPDPEPEPVTAAPQEPEPAVAAIDTELPEAAAADPEPPRVPAAEPEPPEVPPAEPEPPELPAAQPEPPAPAAAPEPPVAATPPPVPAVPVTPQPEFVVAPRDGFHLTDFSELLKTAAAEDNVKITILQEPKPPRNGAAPAAAAAAGKKAKGWKIREVRKVRARHDAPYQVEDTTYETVVDPDAEERGEKNLRFENDPEVVDARRQINDRLRRRRCDEAASLLQRLAAEVGGRPVAELALDAGDRCRALGKSNAALSCYLAASRADPVHEEPLLRLADICLDDKDIDLAVSYLERVARIHRLASDHKGALRLYRKIATIAPYRDDILSVLMRAQATGRFDD